MIEPLFGGFQRYVTIYQKGTLKTKLGQLVSGKGHWKSTNKHGNKRFILGMVDKMMPVYVMIMILFDSN